MIDVALQPKQEKLNELLDTFDGTWVGFGGALGSAKSHGIRAVNLLRRSRYPNTVSLIFRSTLKELKHNHIDPMFQTWPELRAMWHEQDKKLVFPNGSLTYFGAADDERGMKSFIGPEYDEIYPDQAEQIPEQWLRLLSERNRGTRNREIKRHMVPTCNPGGVSHGFLKRIFITRKFHENERPDDYTFLHAFAWDNVEWAMEELERDGLTPYHYYLEWTDKQRFDYFTTRTKYGQKLNALPAKRRNAMLLGQWNEYDGQYFDVFNPETTPIPADQLVIAPNHPKWISCDYGYAHMASVYWHAQVTAAIRALYREFSSPGKNPEQLAHTIGQLTAGEKIQRFILGSDSFRKILGEESVAVRMGRVLAEYGIPEPEMADMRPGSRATRARAMYDRIGNKTLLISRACRQLIDLLPDLQHDPDDPEDVLKVDGDDPYDGSSYGVVVEDFAVKPTIQEKFQERVKEIPEEDLTSRSMMLMRIEQEEKTRPRAIARMGGYRRR